jgi:hypothetical protein
MLHSIFAITSIIIPRLTTVIKTFISSSTMSRRTQSVPPSFGSQGYHSSPEVVERTARLRSNSEQARLLMLEASDELRFLGASPELDVPETTSLWTELQLADHQNSVPTSMANFVRSMLQAVESQSPCDPQQYRPFFHNRQDQTPAACRYAVQRARRLARWNLEIHRAREFDNISIPDDDSDGDITWDTPARHAPVLLPHNGNQIIDYENIDWRINDEVIRQRAANIQAWFKNEEEDEVLQPPMPIDLRTSAQMISIFRD